MRIFLVTLVCSSLSSSAFAKAVYLGMLKSNVQNAPQLKCTVCHGGSSGMINPFGKDFAKIIKPAADKKSAFKELLSLDSDKDGVSNESELLGGTSPGEINEFQIIEIK